MTNREIFKDKYQAMLQQWTAQLDALSAREGALTAEARAAAQPHIETVTQGLEQARSRLLKFASVTDDKWDDFAAGMDGWWTDTRVALDGAFDALSPALASQAKPASPS